MNILKHKRALAAGAVILAVAGAGIAMNARTGEAPNVTTAEVTRGVARTAVARGLGSA